MKLNQTHIKCKTFNFSWPIKRDICRISLQPLIDDMTSANNCNKRSINYPFRCLFKTYFN